MEIMKMLLLGLPILAVGALLLYLKTKKADARRSAYTRRRPMNSYKQALYWRLIKALPEHVVLAQVAMHRCIHIRNPAFATIAQESLDFVICNKAMSILGVIDLKDGNQPVSERRRKIDEFKEDALETAGIKYLQCVSSALPTEAYIAMEFSNDSPSMTMRLAA